MKTRNLLLSIGVILSLADVGVTHMKGYDPMSEWEWANEGFEAWKSKQEDLKYLGEKKADSSGTVSEAKSTSFFQPFIMAILQQSAKAKAQLPDQNNDSVRLMLILGLSDIQILTKFLSGDYHEADVQHLMKNSLQPYDEEAVCNNHECHHSHFYEQFSIQSQAFQQYVYTFLEHPEYIAFVFTCLVLAMSMLHLLLKNTTAFAAIKYALFYTMLFFLTWSFYVTFMTEWQKKEAEISASKHVEIPARCLEVDYKLSWPERIGSSLGSLFSTKEDECKEMYLNSMRNAVYEVNPVEVSILVIVRPLFKLLPELGSNVSLMLNNLLKHVPVHAYPVIYMMMMVSPIAVIFWCLYSSKTSKVIVQPATTSVQQPAVLDSTSKQLDHKHDHLMERQPSPAIQQINVGNPKLSIKNLGADELTSDGGGGGDADVVVDAGSLMSTDLVSPGGCKTSVTNDRFVTDLCDVTELD